jgi:hypothetical protein
VAAPEKLPPLFRGSVSAIRNTAAALPTITVTTPLSDPARFLAVEQPLPTPQEADHAAVAASIAPVIEKLGSPERGRALETLHARMKTASPEHRRRTFEALAMIDGFGPELRPISVADSRLRAMVVREVIPHSRELADLGSDQVGTRGRGRDALKKRVEQRFPAFGRKKIERCADLLALAYKRPCSPGIAIDYFNLPPALVAAMAGSPKERSVVIATLSAAFQSPPFHALPAEAEREARRRVEKRLPIRGTSSQSPASSGSIAQLPG